MNTALLTRRNLWRSLQLLAFVLVVLGALLFAKLKGLTQMPGVSYGGPLHAFTVDERTLAERLEKRVRFLAETIGPRAFWDGEARARTGAWITGLLDRAGLTVRAEPYEPPGWKDLGPAGDGLSFFNYVVPLGGPGDAPLLVVSAHFDTVPSSPGADDDATGVAVLLELAERFGKSPLLDGHYRVVLCFFDGEEAGRLNMGSLFYARKLSAAGERVAGAISLEMLGTYTDDPGTQAFPSSLLAPFYPDTGNFIAFVGNETSGEIIRSALGAFRSVAQFPSEGLIAPDSIPDVGRSDHANFWAQGWPGLMVTDTANFRNEHYHEETDTPDRVDFLRLARVANGLELMIRKLNRDGL